MTNFFVLEERRSPEGASQRLWKRLVNNEMVLNFNNFGKCTHNNRLIPPLISPYLRTFEEFKEICAQIFGADLLYIQLNNGTVLQYVDLPEQKRPRPRPFSNLTITQLLILTEGGLPIYAEYGRSTQHTEDPNDTTAAGLINVMLKICWEIFGSEIVFFEMGDKRLSVVRAGAFYYLCLGPAGASAASWLGDFARKFAAKHGNRMAFNAIIPPGGWLSKTPSNRENRSKETVPHG